MGHTFIYGPTPRRLSTPPAAHAFHSPQCTLVPPGFFAITQAGDKGNPTAYDGPRTKDAILEFLEKATTVPPVVTVA